MKIQSINNRSFKFYSSHKARLNSPNFKGHSYSFGYFTDQEIADTYRYLKYSDLEWRLVAMNDFISEMSFFKYVFGSGEKEIEARLNEMEKLRNGLKKQEKEKELKEKELKQLREKQILEEKKNLINNKTIENKDFLCNEFFDLINLEKNNNIIVPNGIFILIPDKKNNELSQVFQNLYNWIKTNDNVIHDSIVFDSSDENSFIVNLKEKLNISKKNFEENDKRTLLEIVNLDKVFDSRIVKQATPLLKAIMTSSAEKYKCTFWLNLFQNEVEKIDPILLVDSRMPIKLKIK